MFPSLNRALFGQEDGFAKELATAMQLLRNCLYRNEGCKVSGATSQVFLAAPAWGSSVSVGDPWAGKRKTRGSVPDARSVGVQPLFSKSLPLTFSLLGTDDSPITFACFISETRT